MSSSKGTPTAEPEPKPTFASEDPKLLATIWNWLPAFRAVAQTEHLPTASQRLFVTASALSRSIRQLEEAVGQPLFQRSGRRIVLNTAGARLLKVVEESCGVIESALKSITRNPLDGPLEISSLGVLTQDYVLPAVLELCRKHPKFEPRISNYTPVEANGRLNDGLLDLAFCSDAVPHKSLVVEVLGQSYASVYCGSGHPLFLRTEVSLSELLRHPFSVPGVSDRNLSMDGWRPGVERLVGMRITLLQSNLSVALDGQFLTVLPDVVARPMLEQDRLRKFEANLVEPASLSAVRRESALGLGLVIEAVEAQIRLVDQHLSHPVLGRTIAVRVG